MPILAECECGNRFPAGDREAGRRRQCPVCGELVTIPHPGEPAGAGAESAGAAPAAGWSWRALAFLLDAAMVLIAVAGAIVIAGVEIPAGWDGRSPLPEPVLLIALGAVILPPLLMASMMSLTNGRTPGKMWAGVRVEREDGTPIGFWQAWGREMLKGVFTSAGQSSGFLIPAINYLWPLADDKSRAVHDIICGTRVVDTDWAPGTPERDEFEDED